MTPLISAETWLGAAGCASGSQTCSGTRPAFEPAPSSIRTSTSAATYGVCCGGADRVKSVISGGPGQQAESQQQRQRAEARHHQIDIARLGVAGSRWCAMTNAQEASDMNSQRQQEGEGVVRQHDEVHAGEESGEERQHPVRCGLMPAVAEPDKGWRRAAKIDDDEEERGQRIQAEMGAEPRQSERQSQSGSGSRALKQRVERPGQRNRRHRQGPAVNDDLSDR